MGTRRWGTSPKLPNETYRQILSSRDKVVVANAPQQKADYKIDPLMGFTFEDVVRSVTTQLKRLGISDFKYPYGAPKLKTAGKSYYLRMKVADSHDIYGGAQYLRHINSVAGDDFKNIIFVYSEGGLYANYDIGKFLEPFAIATAHLRFTELTANMVDYNHSYRYNAEETNGSY